MAENDKAQNSSKPTPRPARERNREIPVRREAPSVSRKDKFEANITQHFDTPPSPKKGGKTES